MKAHFTMFARYNAWANQRLYAAAEKLSDAECRADRGAFFKSMHGTLNHLLVTDRIWMRRITGEGEGAGYRLDQILFDDFSALRAAREAEDRRIVSYVTDLAPDNFAGTISYSRVSTPEKFTQPLAAALSHLFNHQTHHRGQAHAILTGLVGAAPELDLLYFQRVAG
jgi:uncharacterized damage-inducible protein DinB